MQGADIYANLFRTGQYGRLYLDSGEHARGKTFHIWVLPDAAPIVGAACSMDGAVEVYGITGGHPGWTETYGWLHHGKWEQDFADLVDRRYADISADIVRRTLEKTAIDDNEKQRKANLLANY